MKRLFAAFIVVSIVFFTSCRSAKKSQTAPASTTSSKAEFNYEMLDDDTYKLTGISEDSTYGYSQKNAVCVAGGASSGPSSERKYLNGLLGPNGEQITYVRRGSCCPVKSENGLMGFAMLDIYEITYDGIAKPVIIYLNMYDAGSLKAPKGFTFRK